MEQHPGTDIAVPVAAVRGGGDLAEVEADDVTACLADAVQKIHQLLVLQAAGDRSAGVGTELRIQGVDVDGEIDLLGKVSDHLVPMLAPMMTPIAWPNSSSPAFTKLTTMIVVAVELWMSAVTPIPVRICVNGLEVMAARMRRMPSPATFCSPLERRLRPKRKRVTAPRRVRI